MAITSIRRCKVEFATSGFTMTLLQSEENLCANYWALFGLQMRADSSVHDTNGMDDEGS